MTNFLVGLSFRQSFPPGPYCGSTAFFISSGASTTNSMPINFIGRKFVADVRSAG
jgi:hypothetical protein